MRLAVHGPHAARGPYVVHPWSRITVAPEQVTMEKIHMQVAPQSAKTSKIWYVYAKCISYYSFLCRIL